ncbi:hypothetical protein PSH61_20450 [Pseudomonas rhodesiae]|uniref:hypothetical protein n=1 Tax=Pseudomonas rhodesiae TaxID=76760 RepID=UPI0027325126|nr:hypothetical protein [Pseudomonas rhodesiae]WLI28172.1 hypothetical protein PSH61_20450 [Pseudomonas rhodesiae]
MRDLGEAGEAAFSSWCAIAGITANKSIKDRHGWDLFIELEGKIDISDAAQLHEPLIECKVQIKTTDARKRTLPVTLSNLKAMATTPLPAFYVLLEFDNSEEPKKVFIRHIDESIISEILRRVRVETTKSKKADLHKKTMQIKFSKDTEIQPLSAKNIRSFIEKVVGPSPSGYVKSKQSYMKKVGFEKDAFSLNFSIEGEQNLEGFINMHLGIDGSTEIQNISSFSKRFGISTETNNLKSDSAVLKLMEVTADGEGSVQFRDRSDGSSVRYVVGVYRVGLASWIPKKYQKLRLSADAIDIQISIENNKMVISYNFQNRVPREVSEHIKLLKLVGILRTPNNVDITITIDDRKIHGKLNGPQPAEDFDYYQLLQLLEILKNVKEYFNLEDPLRLSLDDIYRNRQTILNCKKLLAPSASGITFSFNLESATPLDSQVACLYVIALQLGDVSFFDLISMKGLLSKSDTKKHKLSLKETQSLYKTTTPTAELEKNKIIEDIQRASENYTYEHPIIDLTGDFLKAIEKIPSK